MSCQVNVTASITDVEAIRRCLFPTDDSRGSDSWLQQCQISVCPTGDIIVIGKDRRLVILSAKWDSTSSQTQFHVTYSGSIHESDNIRALACLPIVSQTKTSHVVPDWTCVLIGFDSGVLRFYTENCDLLLEEQLHNEVISNIKCRSQHNPRPDIAPDLHPEEIYVQFQSTVCVIAGNQLFPILRVCRGELAKIQAKGDVLEPSQGTINSKKWGFHSWITINDVAVVGVNLHGTFDHLLTASTCGGFDTKYRTSGPYNNLVLAAGSRPFVGYHYALEGAAQPVFSDVANAVATKLKSALPSWLIGTKTLVEKQMTVAMQPSESMDCRFGLCDLRRTATNIVLSPDHKLAVVSDALGRVLLLDAFRGITLRIFKGYREAQCSFIQVPDERHSKHRIGNKIALFLVIYSPKKGTLEIFTTQHGQKVTTFSASKFSKLIYNNYGLMGFSTMSKSRYICQYDTILIDNDGQIKELLIPFHFVLSEKNNKRARDIHLFKRIKQFLRQGDCDNETFQKEILALCPEFQTNELKLQLLELLLSEKKLSLDFILKCVELYSDDNKEENENLKIMAENSAKLLNFYKFVQNEEEDVANGNLDKEKDVETKLKLDVKQTENLQKLLDINAIMHVAPAAKVGFLESCKLSPAEFLSLFDLSRVRSISLRKNQDESLLFNVSESIFKKVMEKPDAEDVHNQIAASTIIIKDLFHLLIYYWVQHTFSNNMNLEIAMNSLYCLILFLGKAAIKDEVEDECGLKSKFWAEVRDILSNSSRPFPALIAAIVCKIVSEEIELSTSVDDETLEVLSQESVEWGLLIGKLEDVSLLNIILSNKPAAKSSTLPKLKHHLADISLRYILEKGKGSVSELVACWLTMSGVDPENVRINDILLRRAQTDDCNGSDDDDAAPEQDIMPHKVDELSTDEVFNFLNILKAQFPYSLDGSVLLANMCWEYALVWQKNIEDVSYLEACVECLSHIKSCQIREGIFNLVWNTHLKILFESASKLVNKVGKLPKERLCKQDTGLSDYQLAIFLGTTTNFLDCYMDAVQQSFGLVKPTLQFEPIWDNGPQPLVELALQQKPINYDMLHLHYQLSVVLQTITAFSIKQSKPLNTLFESYMLGLFFADLQTIAHINWNYTDSKVQSLRLEFLFKVISASLETVTLNEEQVYAADHMNWMTKCLNIARLWNLDLDVLRRFELSQIYTNGFDRLGDELFRGIEDKNALGLDLLAIAARRMSQFLTTSPNLCQNMAALNTVVSRYLENLTGDWCASSSLEAIENLANRSLSCIEDSQHEYKVAEALLDGCQTLQNIYKSNS